MALRLYSIRNEVTRKLSRDPDTGEVLYFSSKRRAKKARNQWSEATKQKHVAVLGPDHKRAK